MKIADAIAIAAKHTKPTYTPMADPFGGLSEDTLAKMRGVVARVQALGLPLEVHPQLASTFSFGYDGALYSVSAVGPKEEIVVSVQGQIGAVTLEDLLHVLPDPEAPDPVRELRLSPLPPPRPDQAMLLQAILEELREIKARLP